jgi:hypothetical protein
MDKWPEEIEVLQDLMEGAINDAVRARCHWGTPPYDVIFSEEGPFTQNILESNLVLGRTTVTYQNLVVIWNTSPELEHRSYTWRADMVIRDGLGWDNGPDVMLFELFHYYTTGSGFLGIYPDREVIRARRPLSGDGICYCLDGFLPNLPYMAPVERYRILWENNPFTRKPDDVNK